MLVVVPNAEDVDVIEWMDVVGGGCGDVVFAVVADLLLVMLLIVDGVDCRCCCCMFVLFCWLHL